MKVRLMALMLALALCLCGAALGEAAGGTPTADQAAAAALHLPTMTETDCEWDEAGNLISETSHTADGQPALNAKGYYRAEYTWDEKNNPLTAAYFGLGGEPVAADTGYARVEYTWAEDSNGQSLLLSEQRYAPDGSTADIPGSYSVLRNTYGPATYVGSADNNIVDGSWVLLATEYFAADGSLTRPTGGYAQIINDVVEDDTTRTVVTRYLDADGSALIGPTAAARPFPSTPPSSI